MEPDGLSSLVPRSAANQGLFGFVLFSSNFRKCTVTVGSS